MMVAACISIALPVVVYAMASAGMWSELLVVMGSIGPAALVLVTCWRIALPFNTPKGPP